MTVQLADRLFNGLVSVIGRRHAWRLGRRLYTAARGEPTNDMDINGEVDLIRAVLSVAPANRPLRVWDVGGNLGEWTDRLISCAADAARAIAVDIFEPAPVAFAILEDHFKGHSAIAVHRIALSSRRGSAKFEMVGPTAGTNSLNLSGSYAAELIDVEVETADAWLAVGEEAPDFVKIDAEGHDLEVIAGMETMLSARRIGVVQFEYNWRWLINGSSIHRLFDLANRVNYRVGRMRHGKIEFFESWNGELDRFIESNFLLARPDVAARLKHRVIGWDSANLPVNRPALAGYNDLTPSRQRPDLRAEVVNEIGSSE